MGNTFISRTGQLQQHLSVCVCFTNWPGCRSVPPHCWRTEPVTEVPLSFCLAGSALESLKKKKKNENEKEMYKKHNIACSSLNASRGRKRRNSGYLIPHLQDFFWVGVHWNELVGYSSLAGSVFLRPLWTRNAPLKEQTGLAAGKCQAKRKIKTNYNAGLTTQKTCWNQDGQHGVGFKKMFNMREMRPMMNQGRKCEIHFSISRSILSQFIMWNFIMCSAVPNKWKDKTARMCLAVWATINSQSRILFPICKKSLL